VRGSGAIDASGYWSYELPSHCEDKSSQCAGKDYNEDGICHQEPSGQLFIGPLNHPSLMSLAGKDGPSCSVSTERKPSIIERYHPKEQSSFPP
jgi:hypothetical protein